jgi:16S rRNA (cytosine1402-N4)-methyltransferase
MKEAHQPVLLNEVIEYLAIKDDGIYIDGTFGRGGHSQAILQRLKTGQLLAFDKDPAAIKAAQSQGFTKDLRFAIYHASFAQLQAQVAQAGLVGKVNGILLDLGVSSPQLDDAERGFSFLRDGPLDMRMNPQMGISAAQWLDQVKEAELSAVLKDYGEERYARRIARAIIEARPLTTTGQLAEVISKAHPNWERHKHPATRSFQAIRIYINQELADLRHCLEQCLDVLKIGGRLLAISFHSLEDRIVKDFMQLHIRGGDWPKDLPLTQAQLNIRIKRIAKAVRATDKEVNNNPRARSATLRIMEKLI